MERMPSSTGVAEGGGRRRPGGRGAGLTRDQIVEAAIALMDGQGTAALTIRALAGRLGVESAALYWHFGGKDEICRAVVDAIGSQLRTDVSTSGTARERLVHHLAAIRSHWLEHPSALELSLRFPPSAHGEVTRAGVELIEALGVASTVSLERYRALVWSVNGFVILEQRLHSSAHHRLVEPGGTRWVVSIEDGDDVSTGELDTDALFDETVELLLRGLEAEAADR
jgi:TetR/AcrR family tetracycline transcriptional repressor